MRWPNRQKLGHDVWFGLRSAARHPGLTLIHVGLIAVSIGLACTAFIVTDVVMLRSLPAIPEPEQLVLVSGVGSDSSRIGQPLKIHELLAEFREGTTHLFAYRNYGALPASIESATVPVRAIGIVGDYFGGLGVPLVIGRAFDPDLNEPVAVISYRVWQQHFGGTPNVLGRTVTLGTLAFSVVGVARTDFVGTQPDLPWDVITPLGVLHTARGTAPAALGDQMVYTVARLEPDVSSERYETSIRSAWPRILEATVPSGSSLDEWSARRGSRIAVDSLRTGQAFTRITTPGLSRALILTMALSVLIFLASCVTVALLAVARGIRDQPQTAIRLALGGSRGRVLRSHIVEAFAVSLLGCIGGLLIALWGSSLAESFLPGDWPISLTSSAVSVALAMAAVTTIVGGGFAGYLASRGSIRAMLIASNRASQPYVKLRAALLVAQFAVSVILVYSTLIYVDDLRGLTRVDVGVDTDNLHVYMLTGRLPQRDLRNDYFQRLVSELQRLPGADSVGLSGGAPPLGFIRDVTEPVRTDEGREVNVVRTCVFPGAFESWRTRQLAGRDLQWTDGPAAVVTESLARKLYPTGNPLGRRIRPQREAQWGSREVEIVGIIGNIPFNGPRLGPRDVAFIPCLAQMDPWRSGAVMNIFVRSNRGLADVGRDVSKVLDGYGAQYIYIMEEQEQFVAWSIERERILATVSGAFGGLILTLTGVALYAFCSYMLSFRKRELAIRASLGAEPHDVAAALLRETATVLVLGMVTGFISALVLTRVVSGYVVDVGPVSLGRSAQAALILSLVAVVAASIPTVRAVRIDLARALRVD